MSGKKRKQFLPGVVLLVVILTTVFIVAESSTVSHDLVNPGLLSQPHAFLKERCSACHTPVKGVEAENCITCHANDEALLQRQPTAFHATITSCKECHIEHLGRVKRPIYMDHDALCLIGARQEAVFDKEVASQSNGLARYMKTSGSPACQSQLNCVACHEKEDPHSGNFGLNCAICHETDHWSITDFRHPSPRSRDCAQCHQAPPCHHTAHFKKVCAQVAGKPNAKVNECYSCHQSTAWNDIKGVGWYKSH